jgi:hypothetical protein
MQLMLMRNDVSPFIIGPFVPSRPRARHPRAHTAHRRGDPNLRSAPTKNPPAGELPHMARAREALRHRCDAEEEPMSDLAARFAYSPLLSTAFKVVCLFCVLGLALSVAIVPMIAPEHLAWALSHIE